MDVQLTVWHLHPVAGKGGTDGLQQAVIYIPVVPGGGPGPQEIVDAACAIAGQADLRRGVGEDLGELLRLACLFSKFHLLCIFLAR